MAESRALGLAVELAVGDDVQASALVGHAAYRAVQEALTNVHKHAPGARTDVTVSVTDSHL